MYPIIIQFLEDSGRIPKTKYNIPSKSNNINNNMNTVTKFQSPRMFFGCIFRTMMEKGRKFFSF